MLELGGNITLSGFKEIDPATMIIVKKIVGNYAKTFSETNEKFQSLTVTMKTVHEREKSEIYELKAHLVADKDYNASTDDRNLLVAVDSVLKKVEKSISS